MVPNNLAGKITRLVRERDLKAQLIKLAKKGKNPDVEKNIECLKTLNENNIPVMLFHGKRDTIMTIDTLQEFQRILETPAKNVAIFDAHHMPGMD
jgi:pimeloyl-ACP methyl ester carboxylesterase